MMTFASRRRRNILIALIVSAVVALFLWAYTLRLNSNSFASGWILLVVMLFLTAYNFRKKIPFMPLLNSRTWLQLHIYLGFGSILLFALHTGVSVNGPFETFLAALYAIIVITGLFGLFITRTFPQRLTVRGEEVLFERMPVFRRRIADRAEELVLKSVEETGNTTIADFYHRSLSGFFADFKNCWRHLVESQRSRHQLAAGFADLNRMLNDQEREYAGELNELAQVKDDLDYQHALQKTLKYWLFVHLGATYSLLVVVVVHIVLVHAFTGGVA